MAANIPLQLMQRLAALLPRPRLHRIRFYGVLAPNAKLRARVAPTGPATEQAGQAEQEAGEPHRSGRIGWARLLKRVFDIDMSRCPDCGQGELSILAPILERVATVARTTSVQQAGSRHTLTSRDSRAVQVESFSSPCRSSMTCSYYPNGL